MKKNTKLESQNLIVEKKNQNDLRNLEQDFVDSKVEEMQKTIEAQKTKLVQEMTEYADRNYLPCKWDRDGNALDYKVKLKPLVINNYFFKSICPIGSVEPQYNAEKLALVFDYYMDLIAKINEIIGDYPSSLTTFCKLAGITLNTLRNYKNSDDLNMRIIAEKIYDQIGDENLTMGQLGVVQERTTLFKLKSQNELTEAQRPNINVNITEKVDTKMIQDRINKYKNLVDKKK